MKIINHLEKIINLFGEDGLSEAFFNSAKDHLEAVAGFLQITNVQAALFALILENDPIDTKKLSGILNCKRVQMIQYGEDFDYLKERKLIKMTNAGRGTREKAFFVPEDVLNAVRKNVEIKVKTYQALDPEEFFDTINETFDAIESEEIDKDEFMIEIRNILEVNKHICFVKKIDEYNFEENSMLIMFVYCCALLHDDEETLRLKYSMRDVINNTEIRRIEKCFREKNTY